MGARTFIQTAAALLFVGGAAAGCTHAGGMVPVDSPKMLPYQAPDIDEITGIDSSDEEAEAAAPAANQGSAQNPHK